MVQKKAKLGRGLDALLAVKSAVENSVEANTESPEASELKLLPIEMISRSPYQPRKEFDEQALEELAMSIREQGLMQPIVVRKTATQYELIAGERRWRACQALQMASIPALVRNIDDNQAAAMALIENIQREDLNAMEQAIAFNRLKDTFDLTHAEVAEAVGKNRATVTNLLRLLTLAGDVQTFLENGDLEMGHARALLALDVDKQRAAAEWVIAKRLSVRQTEDHVRGLLAGKSLKSATAKQDPDVERLMESLSERIGVPVKITQRKGGKGKLELSYASLDELDGILARIK
ncbi:ParB/RepB/Spo0J family partition protein [Umboniibacter marinipuniceus]|uniref:Probable chromosome-partitioning protein ParB n=1 Tax=Umboniibacter marinipuniceus TaxID=569599 RepID=A0A3M0ASZ5_9GAMM|nr:ParB/RepB/Spo0J family partition protein [Umboniibacter marinipuniceus]RMA82122.1 chromosome segregation DNA-binding protein [Umboniibacter marinipuniceus]